MHSGNHQLPACLVLLLVFAALPGASASAQTDPPPVPEEDTASDPDPGVTGSATDPSEVTPGFDTARSARRSPPGQSFEPEEEDPTRPVNVPDQGDNERLIDQMVATTGEVTLAELIDEILSDVIAELAARPKQWFSPLAIRQVSLGANVVPSFARKLKSTITSHIHAGTDVRVVRCLECDATRTRIEDGKWTITRGLIDTRELREVANKIGAKSFMDVSFGFDPESGVLEMDFAVVRASDSLVLWADSFRADETTPLLQRSSEAPIRRKDRLRDLEMLLEGRPYYGYVATAGFMILPYDDPVQGDITGATAGYRIYERFGLDRRVMFGLDITGFLNTTRLAGAVISAGSWWVPIRPDLTNPELRLGAKAGAFIAGSEGNAAMFQLGAELLLRYRFGLFGYVMFMTTSQFLGRDLGGVGFATGISFNW